MYDRKLPRVVHTAALTLLESDLEPDVPDLKSDVADIESESRIGPWILISVRSGSDRIPYHASVSDQIPIWVKYDIGSGSDRMSDHAPVLDPIDPVSDPFGPVPDPIYQ